MWLFPVSFDDTSTPDLSNDTRYTGNGEGMHPTAPTGIPGYAMHTDPNADRLETSNTGRHNVNYSLAPLPPVHIILAQRAALDPSTQATRVEPAKLSALGMIDAGDLIYGDGDWLTTRVGVVP